jgi:hypothetical protein
MYGSIARVIGAVLLGAAVLGSLVISRYLALLEGGISRDLDSVDRIVTVEKEIQHQNDILNDMVATTQKIGTGLDGIVDTSSSIQNEVVAVGAANRTTLQLNGGLETNNGAAAQQLSRVVAALKAMNQSTSAIDSYLSDLNDTVAGDVDALEAISANTARMNAKTPRVVIP